MSEIPPEEDVVSTCELLELLCAPTVTGRQSVFAAKDTNDACNVFALAPPPAPPAGTPAPPFFFSNLTLFVSLDGDIAGIVLSVGIRRPGSFFITGCLFAYLKPGFYVKQKINEEIRKFIELRTRS